MRIGIGLGIDRRHGSGGGGGGGGSFTAMKLGINQTNVEGWMYSTPFNERYVGAPNNGWSWFDSGLVAQGALPAGNLDSDKWASTLPATGAYISREIFVEPSAVLTLTWQGNFASAPLSKDASVVVSAYDAVARTATVTVAAGFTNKFFQLLYTFTDTVNYPKNIKLTMNGTSGRFTSQYLTELNRYNGKLRFVKWLPAAEQGAGAWAAWGGGTHSSPVYTYSRASRNTPTGGTWLNVYNGAGTPYEIMVECGNAYNGSAVHFNLPYQAADDYITDFATYVRDNLSTSKTIYIEFGNETSFNGAYDSYHQCQNEAIDPTINAGVAISSITKGTPFSLSTTSNISSGSTTVTNVASVTGVLPGMTFAATGVPANTIVKAVNGNQITISQAATATTTGVATTISGCSATLVTSTAHGLVNTEVGAITGASSLEYNTAYTNLTVVNSTTLTITLAATPAGNATVVGAYTHSGYPDLGTGTMRGYLRYIDAARRCMDIWTSVFAGQTSRIKPMLCWQDVDAAGTAAAMSYANGKGWLTNFKAYATAPYWGSHDTVTYGVNYTGAVPAFMADAKIRIDTEYGNSVSHKANADLYGLDFVSYEGDYGQDINDLPTLMAIKTDTTMYDNAMFYYQQMELAGFTHLTCFNFCQPLGTPDGVYGHHFPSILGMASISKTTLPQVQAVIDFVGGLRIGQSLTTTGLSIAANASNGDQVGTVSRICANSTFATVESYGLAISASGAFTVADHTLLPATGAHTVTIRETNPRFAAPGYVDTALSLNVTPALPKDNFNDGTMDATLWQKDTTILAGAHGITITNVTASETGGALSITSSTGTNSNQNGYTTLNTVDLTQLPDHYCKITNISSGSMEVYPLIVGKSGGATVRPRISGTTFGLDHYDTAGTYHLLNGGTGSFSWSSTPWIKLHYDPTGGTSNGAPVSTITHSTTTATVTTTEAHNMATGNSVTVSGATPSAYNGTFAITVTGATTFTYTMLSDPGANASVVGSFTFTPSGRFTFYSAPTTAANPPAAGDWTAVPNLSNIARPFDVPTTALMAFLKTGTAGTFAIDCFNTASG